eukprot:3397021-Rhodomonas_salina.2
MHCTTTESSTSAARRSCAVTAANSAVVPDGGFLAGPWASCFTGSRSCIRACAASGIAANVPHAACIAAI